jgi:hypothetical protein
MQEWREIISSKCEKKDYIDLKGRKNTSDSAQSKTFAALEPCYFKVMLWVFTQDAAKKMNRHMTTMVKFADVVNII